MQRRPLDAVRPQIVLPVSDDAREQMCFETQCTLLSMFSRTLWVSFLRIGGRSTSIRGIGDGFELPRLDPLGTGG